MIETEAIVLHTFEYRETSRIVRLATRGAGVVSAVARGARRPKTKFGQGLDLFTSGVAHLSINPTRDLHTLTAFDATHGRPRLAASMSRFGAATALGEIAIRFGSEASQSDFHDILNAGLDALASNEEEHVGSEGLMTAWLLVAELGFAPSLDDCSLCRRDLEVGEEVRFGQRSGGALCRSCAPLSGEPSRPIPSEARATLRSWLEGRRGGVLDSLSMRAHQRLLREFLEAHLGDGRPLKAWNNWEGIVRDSPSGGG